VHHFRRKSESGASGAGRGRAGPEKRFVAAPRTGYVSPVLAAVPIQASAAVVRLVFRPGRRNARRDFMPIGFARIALAILGLLAASPGPAAAQSAPAAAPTAAQRAEFETGLLGASSGAIFRAIKREFPQDYEAMLTDMLRQAMASSEDVAALERVGFNAVRTFYVTRLREILNAPAPALNAYNARELALLKTLSEQDKALCSMYATTGFQPGTQVPPAVQPAMLDVGLAMIGAAKAGIGRPVDPQRGHMAAEDGTALVAKLRELDPSETMRRYLAGDQTAIADPVEGCRVGIVLYTAIAALPAEQSARVTANIIQSSLARQH
jgi:hypothetical protein